MPRTLRVSRRGFLAAGAAAVAAPYFVPSRVFGANERIVTAHIGVGRQGTSNLNDLMKQGAIPAAICDVDKDHLAKVLKDVADKGHTCEGYGDYRRILDRTDIDAVAICTPDHWHALTAIHACQAGKDVYCEKPLSLTVLEGRRMVDAARANKRIVQTGSQQRSDDRFRLACELVRNGRLGDLKEVQVGIPNVNFSDPPVPDSDPPAVLDYEFWLGPAPQRPYNKLRVHYNFRFFWDYSGGQMTNWGAHHIDIAQWALDMDHSGPISVEGTAEFHPEGWYEVTNKCRLTFTYSNGVKLVVGQTQDDIKQGCTFIGTKGTVFVDRKQIVSTPEGLAKEALKDTGNEVVRLYKSANHHQNFLDCIKTRKLPICDVEIGHRSATVCHLGNIALRLGRKLQWDPVAEEIVGDESAARMLSRPYRRPWELG